MFYLYKVGEGDYRSYVPAARNAYSITFTISSASPAIAGSYACAYQIERSGTLHKSARSLNIDIKITDSLPKPTLALSSRRDVFLVGESITIHCVAPSSYSSSDFYVQMSNDNHTVEKFSSKGTHRVHVTFTDVTLIGQHNLSCFYQSRVRWRYFNSTLSDILQVTVTDRPPGPRISTLKLSVRFRQTVQITCTAHAAYAGSTFHLYKGGTEQHIASQLSPPRVYSGRFTIDATNKTNDGNYSCQYEARLLGQTYSSLHSEPLTVAIPDDAQLRLAEAASRCFGTVEVYDNRQWGPVCDRSWKLADAEVVCRHLGCGFANALGRPRGWTGASAPPMLSDVDCRGTEALLWQCSLQPALNYYRCGRSQHAAVNCTMKPEKPVIRLGRSPGLFIQGEAITVHCTAYSYYAGSLFHLHKVGQAPVLSSLPAPEPTFGVTFTIANANLSDGGSYTCFYQAQRAGELHNSTGSRSVEITVTDRPPKPLLSLRSRASSHLIGDQDVLDCSAPTYWEVSEFFLYSVLGDTYLSERNSTESGNRASFPIANLSTPSETNYSCQYSLQSFGRPVKSLFSDLVTIAVTGDLLKPRISLQRGTPIHPFATIVTCSVSVPYFGGHFDLYEAGVESFVRSHMLFGRDHSTSFQLEAGKGGNYTCQYKVVKPGRVFSSPQSDSVRVSSHGK
ncbi:immunoglobulin superfamily member 1-like [Heptranchias perlo]|uniref:immunoglobulin superfamily member 1-like n=1 Tax=Heptranchias perlo TaxID=212740 RepID=UPI00355A7462